MAYEPHVVLCCPCCRGALSAGSPEGEGGCGKPELYCKGCGRRYAEMEGLIDFNHRPGQKEFSRRFRIMRSLYASIYTPATNLMFIPCGGPSKARLEVLERLELSPGATVLETGIGTGDNLPYLSRMANGMKYYGVDNQERMLRVCQKNLRSWSMVAQLYVANAESLPFKDRSFDVVFHLGAINIFSDPAAAIMEMARVARPGSRIVIADESEKAARYFNVFTGRKEKVVPPLHLVPPGMEDTRLHTIWKGYGYLIEFRLPG